MKLKLETWQSSNKHEEHHFFLNNKQKEIYVIGFNPQMLSDKAKDLIMMIARMDLKGI